MEKAIKELDAKALSAAMVEFVPIDAQIGDAQQYRLTKLKTLLSQAVAEVGRMMAMSNKAETSKMSSQGDVCLVVNEAQLLEPRGRFTASLSSVGLLLEGKQQNMFVPWSSVSHCACVPSNATTKKEGEDLLALYLSEPIKNGNKDIRSLLWNLSKSTGTKPLSAVYSSSSFEGTESHVVTSLVEQLVSKKIVLPQRELFQSILMQNKPYLRCYKGIQEGVLYPLKNGLLFVKPMLFIPAEEVASLTAGRGGGSGNTRYVDLQIETADGKVHEFTNIERDELPAIQVYVKGHLEARKKADEAKKRAKSDAGHKAVNGGDKSTEEGGDGGDDEDDDDDEEDDEDFDPDASDEDGDGDNDDDDDDDKDDEDFSGSGSDSDDDDSYASESDIGDDGEEEEKVTDANKSAAAKNKKSPKKHQSPKKAEKENRSPGEKRCREVAEETDEEDDMNVAAGRADSIEEKKIKTDSATEEVVGNKWEVVKPEPAGGAGYVNKWCVEEPECGSVTAEPGTLLI